MKKIILFLCFVFLLSGCSTKEDKIKKTLKNHNYSEIVEICQKAKENNDIEEYNKILTSTINGYASILLDFYSEDVNVDVLEGYMKDIERLKATFEFMVSNNINFSNKLDLLYDDFQNLKYSRDYLYEAMEAFKKNDYSTILKCSKNIPIFDMYSMQELTKVLKSENDVDVFPIKFLEYNIDTKGKTLNFTLKNNSTNTIKSMIYCYVLYDKNNEPIILDTYERMDDRVPNIGNGRVLFDYDEFKSNAEVEEWQPYFLDYENLNVIFIPISCSDTFGRNTIENNFAYIQIFEEILKLELPIEKLNKNFIEYYEDKN